MLMYGSDGDTPEKQVEQILAITPILPGQKPTQKNQIPPHHKAEKSTAENSTTTSSPPQSATSQNFPQAPSTSSGNTIAYPSPISTPKAGPVSSSKAVPVSSGNDLVDFGQNDGPPVAPSQQPTIQSQMPADLYAAQTQNGGQQQKELENILHSTGTIKENEGGLIDFHRDLRKELPGNQSTEAALLKKRDTDTDSVDEFVDAES
jgi:hypothetical protein